MFQNFHIDCNRMARSAANDQGLHYLLRPVSPNTYGNWDDVHKPTKKSSANSEGPGYK